MYADATSLVHFIGEKSEAEILSWLGDALRSEKVGFGAAPLSRHEAEADGRAAVQEKQKELEQNGFWQVLKTHEGHLAASGAAATLSTAISLLPQCGIPIPDPRSVAWLVVAVSIWQGMSNIKWFQSQARSVVNSDQEVRSTDD